MLDPDPKIIFAVDLGFALLVVLLLTAVLVRAEVFFAPEINLSAAEAELKMPQPAVTPSTDTEFGAARRLWRHHTALPPR